jgi:hypothetical protein
LFWLGDPKLVIVTAPVPESHLICERWGYPETVVLSPKNPTHQLSLNIIDEPKLLERIVDFAGAGRTVQLVPYATTPEFFQLVEVLRTRYQLTVILPESPSPDHLWLRDYVDSKVGFRTLVSYWLGEKGLFPRGFICREVNQAAEIVAWFLRQGCSCVVKADGGESGIGHIVFSPEEADLSSVRKVLEANPYLCGDLIIVEEYIHSTALLSPSFEFFVPPAGSGMPSLTYTSKQFFSSFGRFAGVMVSRNILQTAWYPLLAERGLQIARELQVMGYVGHFDVDATVDDFDHIRLLELNARRTGGTYVHEFACHYFGSNYLERVVLFSKNAMDSGGITDTKVLLDWLSELLYPSQTSDTGVVITVTSTLVAGEFGCILIAPNEADVLQLDEALQERIRAYRVRSIGI